MIFKRQSRFQLIWPLPSVRFRRGVSCNTQRAIQRAAAFNEGNPALWEDGISVEVKAGEYYIQRAGLTQHARQPSDMPHYFYIHFSGAYGTAADGSYTAAGRLESTAAGNSFAGA